jgi:uncharacterized protein with HEPN domain
VKPTPRDLADDALEHIEAVRHHLGHGVLDDPLVVDAVSLRLSCALDCIGKLPSELREQVCDSAWPEIRATRNRIVHGYLMIDVDVIRAVAERHLDGLAERLGVIATPGAAAS